jgi:thioredoxin reductase (NADPH)
MSPEGFVVTNDQCATNIDGIYVVGDLREKYARQIVLAAADGCMAALSSAHYVEARKAKMEDLTCALPE